jgi:hypothetical protein
VLTTAVWPWPWNAVALVVGATFLLLATAGLYRSNSINGLAGYLSAAWIATNGVLVALSAVLATPLLQGAPTGLRAVCVAAGAGLVLVAAFYASATKRSDSAPPLDHPE